MIIIIVLLCLLLAPPGCERKKAEWMTAEPEITISRLPVFPEKEQNEIIKINLQASSSERSLVEISLKTAPGSETGKLTGATARLAGKDMPETSFVSREVSPGILRLKGILPVRNGNNSFIVSLNAKKDIDPVGSISIESAVLKFSDGSSTYVTPAENKIRFGRVVRGSGQDNVDTYRIPGLVTTDKGTLIAVYDNRYNNSKDLQEDIDIGMSRSTDGGRLWEPMTKIIDMGEYGGRSQRLNGAGDPCVLYDDKTGTIWVAALWMSGSAPDQMLWWASKPGMTPEETGQFVVVKSTDDGLTWSEPINITGQIKDPSWQLLLQGPGRGITMKDGTLVFPAQFKKDTGEKALDGGRYTCHSTIVWSSDQGKTWHIGTGAKSNTTEAQVAEMPDGSLMLNMRDDRNRKDKSEKNGRAVAITRDLGKTWQIHPSSNSALPEPNCMAGFISAEVAVDGEKKNVLFFSNPNDKTKRSKMTIKASTDGGLTWPAENQVELYEAEGFGYSCLTIVDENIVGILYEGTKDLYFQKIPVSEILKKK